MNSYYKNLSPGKKISLNHSMKSLTKDFIKKYTINLLKERNKEDVLNELYFYWLRNSADKKYAWCNNLNEEVFSEQFANEMKITLYIVYCKSILKSLNKDNQERKKA